MNYRTILFAILVYIHFRLTIACMHVSISTLGICRNVVLFTLKIIALLIHQVLQFCIIMLTCISSITICKQIVQKIKLNSREHGIHKNGKQVIEPACMLQEENQSFV